LRDGRQSPSVRVRDGHQSPATGAAQRGLMTRCKQQRRPRVGLQHADQYPPRASSRRGGGRVRARRHRRLCAVVPGPRAVCEIVSTQLGRRRRPDAETHAVSGRHVPLPSLACCRCRPLSYPEEHAAVAVSRCPAFGRQGRRLITPRPSSKNA
jgi:hypothetical protein